MMANEHRPKIGRISVWVDCVCGEEVDFEDVDDMASESVECEGCGRRVEVSVNIFVQEVPK